ncbi:hypothetical protein C5C00_07610 [Rathayibacter rathayi]|uniref:hypothetical protein n=1 Tax=Rathayibacter rathayi TaxID=33887 RepID=UPI000CE793F1|nr:hypothetical protein [Rathayibacter rathayi]PPG88743.1 hypothetical protein C5C47_06275 [Rathayibacter rathayi]PPG96925.1 hypothetical protein C5C00_07610 [Rathayibacter rathayi]
MNAGLVANAAAALGLPGAGQTLGVQAAIGESSLVNIHYGDGAINPDGTVADSIGLFQQQSSWEPLSSGWTRRRRRDGVHGSLFEAPRVAQRGRMTRRRWIGGGLAARKRRATAAADTTSDTQQ